MTNSPIGVFDSGIGGLNVLYLCAKLLPHENFIYLADGANMPYGVKSNAEIVRAATYCASTLFDMNCKAVVIACNTATAVAAERIRALYRNRIVVGLEPAIKPCIEDLAAGEYAVALVTEATFRSKRFTRLVERSGNAVVPVSSAELAERIERARDVSELNDYVTKLLSPYEKASAVVLGCSHYSYITPIIKRIYGDGIKIYDGACGAAVRLYYLLRENSLLSASDEQGRIRFISTYKNEVISKSEE